MNTKAGTAAKLLYNYSIRKSSIYIVRLLFIILFLQSFTIAEIRYVSKTGTSTPPYITWETASDSIQKAINICYDGDTVVVGNGVYKEHLYINTDITLLGSSMDSTVIDAQGLVNAEAGSDSLTTVLVYAKFEMKNFTVVGNQGIIIYMRGDLYGMTLTDMKLENGALAVGFYNGYNKAENLIIRNTKSGFFSGDFFNLARYDINNNIVIIDRLDGRGHSQSGRGTLNLTNNIILHINPNVSTESGITLWSPGRTIIKNNLIAGFKQRQYDDSSVQIDTIYIINNVIGYTNSTLTVGSIYMTKGDKRVLRNNIIINSKEGVESFNPPILKPDYNLYWNVGRKYIGQVVGGENEIEADPMVVKDTVPNVEIDMDMHLQAFSPAIDKGDPLILDTDGTRSDIGMYGGPLAEMYNYLDLAPKEPKGLLISADTNLITIFWRNNTEADFSHYKLFRDTMPDFTINLESFVMELPDTFYIHPIGESINKYYYKVTAVDSQENESQASEEIGIIITSSNEKNNWKTISDYHLFENYPNPFNPVTIIPFRLKERGYVKLIVYDIKGELIKMLLNEEKEAGYYETEFNASTGTSSTMLPSGIYLYRIEVIGKGNIPVYSHMKKMLLIK